MKLDLIGFHLSGVTSLEHAMPVNVYVYFPSIHDSQYPDAPRGAWWGKYRTMAAIDRTRGKTEKLTMKSWLGSCSVSMARFEEKNTEIIHFAATLHRIQLYYTGSNTPLHKIQLTITQNPALDTSTHKRKLQESRNYIYFIQFRTTTHTTSGLAHITDMLQYLSQLTTLHQYFPGLDDGCWSLLCKWTRVWLSLRGNTPLNIFLDDGCLWCLFSETRRTIVSWQQPPWVDRCDWRLPPFVELCCVASATCSCSGNKQSLSYLSLFILNKHQELITSFTLSRRRRRVFFF